RDRIRAAMGVDAAADAPDQAPVRVLTGKHTPHLGQGELVLEDGTRLSVRSRMPPDVPLGYHDFWPKDDASPTRLIVSPGQCVLPQQKLWGWAAQLYATRSNASWGIGDLADLRQLAAWSAS